MLSSSLRLYYALAPCARRRSAALLLEPPPLHHDAALFGSRSLRQPPCLASGLSDAAPTLHFRRRLCNNSAPK